METAEVVVIGGGPGGYVAARRLGQLGVETALVERSHLGGTCLNAGCIPTKALYAATSPLGRREAFARMGVSLHPEVDLDRMRGWVGEVVAKLRAGIAQLLAAGKVEVVRGEGALLGPGRVRVRTADGERELRARAVVLATGSAPIELPGLPFDGERVWSSTDALSLPRIPERLVVVGGGVIGLELATVYRRLGSEVVVAEALDRLLPGVGLSRRGESVLRRSLAAQGIGVRLGAKAEGLTPAGIAVRTGDGVEELPADAVLVAVGRRPSPEGLGLEAVGARAERGFVATDDQFRAAPGVYAIGDLRGGWLLAHKASDEGLRVAYELGRTLKSLPPVEEGPDGGAIPQAIFTHPEVGLVGVPVDEAAARGLKVARFPLAALGRAWAEGETEGHVQLVADGDGRLLGAEIVGPHASDLVAEAALALRAGLTAEDLAETVHAHPTFPEGLWEAALSLLGRPLHSA